MNAERIRNVVLGHRSKVWQRLKTEPGLSGHVTHAIGHADLRGFDFAPTDRVWVLSYSRKPSENSALLRHLQQAGVRDVFYVSTSSAIVNGLTSCYEYPRVKAQAEAVALALPQGKVLTIGLMYAHLQELPGGANVATSYEELAAFMRSPHWPDDGGRRKRLFQVVETPFSSRLETALHGVYGQLLALVPRHPCLLRPIDLALRAFGMRWYGYTYLGNRLWTSTTS